MPSDSGSLLILLLPVFFIGYIFLSQRRRVRALQSMQSSLSVGDEIRTTSGMLGRVSTLDDTTMGLQVADGVVVRFDRRAVDAVLTRAASDGADGPSGTSPADGQ
ncbi:MAG: preprotein translocase subunit YajC [Dermatophilaceae bacterium]